MKPVYVCDGCGREISNNEYEKLSEFFCGECGGHIEEKYEIPTTQTSSELDSNNETAFNSTNNSLLISCESCSHKFSKRANECPKCGWKPLIKCLVCNNKISYKEVPCPECGDPTPFLDKNEIQKTNSVNLNIQKNIPVSSRTSEIFAYIVGIFIMAVGVLCIGGIRNAMGSKNIGAIQALILLMILYAFYILARFTTKKIKAQQTN